MHTQGVLDAPSSKNPEDSSQASVEAMQFVPSAYPPAMIAVTENISHSTAKLCLSTIMHVPHPCSDCQWHIFQ
jgi:hypothetical protein